MADIQEQQVRLVSLEDLKKRMESTKSYILADARDADSYYTAHIPGSISIPADEVDRLADQYDREIDVITYCGGYQCPASTAAAKAFLRKGFRHVWDFKGGMEDWTKAGEPLESNR
jgi:rhodanese-related sulfurtransferase